LYRRVVTVLHTKITGGGNREHFGKVALLAAESGSEPDDTQRLGALTWQFTV